MTTRSRHDGGGRKFLRIRCYRGLASPELQLCVLVFEDSRRCNHLHAARGKYRLGVSHAVRFQQRKSLEEFRADVA